MYTFRRNNGNRYSPSFREQGFDRSSSYLGSRSGDAPRKRTGASAGNYNRPDGKGQRSYVRGWRVTPFGIVTYLCTPYVKSKEFKTKTGRIFYTWLAKITFADGRSERRPCLYWPDKGHCVIDSMNIVVNPKAPNGGYCGRNFRKR